MKYPLPCWEALLLLMCSHRRFPSTPTSDLGRLSTPRKAHASGNGCFPGTSILIYLLYQHEVLRLSKADAAPSGPRWPTALCLLARWVRHGVGNHGKDIHRQLGRVIGNSSMLSSARGPRQVSGAPNWHEGRGHPHSRAFRAPHHPPRCMSVCAGLATQRSTDTMCICKC